ncbi:hypothetical protein [Clostridium lacusfryxellense]|uniref:hypothetical protein n=1 Tax=Clostridium lacusfryxellense TaxID=205328 RepID=UPI001C0DB061|nr:hypothetical protein [Clostridium lacusfryxellense]MBU3113808.1 hypothetical protein [Clostridium lacusfryxellense]
MKKYRITLNDKVYEVDIEEVTKASGEEGANITEIGSLDKPDNTKHYFGSNENGV